jgi:hypothetical protein
MTSMPYFFFFFPPDDFFFDFELPFFFRLQAIELTSSRQGRDLRMCALDHADKYSIMCSENIVKS